MAVQKRDAADERQVVALLAGPAAAMLHATHHRHEAGNGKAGPCTPRRLMHGASTVRAPHATTAAGGVTIPCICTEAFAFLASGGPSFFADMRLLYRFCFLTSGGRQQRLHWSLTYLFNTVYKMHGWSCVIFISNTCFLVSILIFKTQMC